MSIQGNEDLMNNTLKGHLRKLDKVESFKLVNERELKQLSDTMFDKFDIDAGGKLELDEFIN